MQTHASPGPEETGKLRARILKMLASPKYQPLDKVELSRKLGLKSEDRSELRALLREMEEAGTIARIRKDRYVIPQDANLFTGLIRFRQTGTAWLECEGGTELFIAAENTWTAMDRDRVVARLVHEGVRDARGGRGSGGGGREQREQARAEGRVIRILQRANETIVGTVQRSKQFIYVIPDSPRLVHNIYVRPPTARESGAAPVARVENPQPGDKVVVRVHEWKSRHVNPEGEIIEWLGPAQAPGVDMLSIIRKHGLPTEFPAAVLREAERISETVDEKAAAGRLDLRDGPVIMTIDPDDARDFDDAIGVERTPHGWRLGVHIADVSHYVRPGGALDREALRRGNSVYLADRVIPMLPERLSNGICSLKPHVDRLTQSAFIDFSPAGKIRRVRFAHTVIRSAARLTYKQAFALLTGNEPAPVPSHVPDRTETVPPWVASQLQTAWELAALLRRNRFAHGSLDLDFPEVKVWLDRQGRPVRLEKIENDISHQLIEEFMLAANEVVAREFKNRLLPSIYRIHEDPDPEKLAEFRELALGYGLRVGDLTQRGEVQRFLASIRGKAEEYVLKLGFLRSLKRATYDTSPAGHYGLAKVNYTHFTSPIRRYADLIVHRVFGQLPSARGGGHKDEPPGNEMEEKERAGTNAGGTGGRAETARRKPVAVRALPEIAEHISETERVAAEAEKDSTKLKKLEFFQSQLRLRKPDAFEAVVVDVRSYGLLVELPDALLTGLIHVSSLQDDFYVFDPGRLCFFGRRRRKTYRIGDRFPVIVSRVDVHKQQVDFAPVPLPPPAQPPGRKSSR